MSISEIEKLYENYSVITQSQMSQLFEWLQSHSKQILLKISHKMKVIHFDWNLINIFSIITATIKQDEINSLFIDLIEYYYIIK